MIDKLITPPIPRLIGMLHASAFLGISPRTFERLWRSYQVPQPHRIGRRLLWDVKLLERYVDELSGIEHTPTNEGW